MSYCVSEELPSGARGLTAETADNNQTLGPVDQYCAAEDIQSKFTAIKDTLTKVKLPANLHLCESRQSIQWLDQTAFNILSCCGLNAETTIKLLSTIDEEKFDEESLQQLFSVQLAQIRYLQEG